MNIKSLWGKWNLQYFVPVLFLIMFVTLTFFAKQALLARPKSPPTTEQKLEACQHTVDELANAVTILAVTHKAGLVGTTCMVDMDTDELELGQRFKACKLAWTKQRGGE